MTASVSKNGSVPRFAWATIVSRCIVDSEGNRVFSDADVPDLNKLPGKDLLDAANAILTVNGMTAGAAEEIAKNSEEIPTNNSGSN